MTEHLPEQPVCEAVVGQAEFLRRAAEMAQAVRKDLAIFSQDLDRRTYGSDEFIEPLKSFLLAHERARLRVLVLSPSAAMKTGHRLVELGRRLSSRIEFRELPPERRETTTQEFIIADEFSLLVRESPDEVEARYYPHAPLLAREQLRNFDTLWQESSPVAEFRDLRI